MKNLLLLLSLQFYALNVFTQIKTDNLTKFDLQKSIDSIKKLGVNQYLLYEITCAGECEFKLNCNCNNHKIVEAVLFYQIEKKIYFKVFECCVYHSPVNIQDSFFIRISEFSNRFLKANSIKNKNIFFPPVATDQITHEFLYYKSGVKFYFQLSEAQITNGSEEQSTWNEYEEFKMRMLIFTFVKTHIH